MTNVYILPTPQTTSRVLPREWVRLAQAVQAQGGPGAALPAGAPAGGGEAVVPLRLLAVRAGHRPLLPPRPLPGPLPRVPPRGHHAAELVVVLEEADGRVVGRPRHQRQVVALLQVPPPRLPPEGPLRVPRLQGHLRGRAPEVQGLRLID